MENRFNPVYGMPKPWEPQTRQQIEKEMHKLSGRLVQATAEETYKLLMSFPKKIEYTRKIKE